MKRLLILVNILLAVSVNIVPSLAQGPYPPEHSVRQPTGYRDPYPMCQHYGYDFLALPYDGITLRTTTYFDEDGNVAQLVYAAHGTDRVTNLETGKTIYLTRNIRQETRPGDESWTIEGSIIMTGDGIENPVVLIAGRFMSPFDVDVDIVDWAGIYRFPDFCDVLAGIYD